MKLERVISGGQTGADQGGLDGAIEMNFPHGGMCPKGRLSEKGPIPQKYNLTEHSSDTYPPRTYANVKNSDATVIFTMGPMERGSALTRKICGDLGKPWIHIDLAKKDDDMAILTLSLWVDNHDGKVLNVAGNRESKAPGIGGRVKKIIAGLIKEKKGEGKGERNAGTHPDGGSGK